MLFTSYNLHNRLESLLYNRCLRCISDNSQRCPHCGTVHKNWADLSNRYHICNQCNFEIERDRGSVLVMYNVATNKQQGFGTNLLDDGCLSSTSLTSKRKHTGSMKQLGQLKRQKSQRKSGGSLETPSVFTAG